MPSLRETIDKSDNNSLATMIVADYLDKNFIIDTIEPFVFSALNGAPLSVFDAKILYFGVEIIAGGRNGIPVATSGFVELYNEANALKFSTNIVAPVYDTVAVATVYHQSQLELKNVWFSRYNDSQYTFVNFIGYTINLV